MASTSADALEQERLELLAELGEDEEPGWLDRFKPGSLGCHELLDRTFLLSDSVQGFILTHPACVQNPEWYALASQAAEALNELYQKVGAAQVAE